MEPKTLVLPGGDGAPSEQSGSLFFVGTATVVLRYAGFTLLTDPNFLHAGDHVHLGYGLHAERRTDPAIELEQLPAVDLVVLSHLHEDHFDRVVAERLDKDLPIVTTPEAARKLRDEHGFRRTIPLATWEALDVVKGGERLRITAVPARHGPPVVEKLLPEVMGSLLAFGDAGLRLYVSGDTLVHEALAEIPRRFPDIDMALLHLGGTRVLGVLVTMDAAQGVGAIRIIGPRLSIPIHYDDYDVFRSPLEDFVRAVREAGLERRVYYVARGDTFTFDVGDLRRSFAPPPKAPWPRRSAVRRALPAAAAIGTAILGIAAITLFVRRVA